MIPEEQTDPASRFLYADTWLSDSTLAKWQHDAIARCKDKKRMEAPYQQFINWRRQENEVALFTSYAYADFRIPKQYDCIFDMHNPENNIRVHFTITQSIWEGWFPVDFIEARHKHLCILQFEEKPPAILFQLPEEEVYQETARSPNALGLCLHATVDALIKHRMHIAALKDRYGDKWEAYYDL